VKHLLTLLVTCGMCLAQFSSNKVTAYITPGPWAECQAFGNSFPFSVSCDTWRVQGEPITYDLFMSTTEAQAVGYIYAAVGYLDSSGEMVTLRGVVRRTEAPGSRGASLVVLDFGGMVHGQSVLVYGLAARV
jgi:hypothetical protein